MCCCSSGAVVASGRATRCGFSIAEGEDDETGETRTLLAVDGDRWNVIPREGVEPGGRRKGPITFSSLDFEGTLVVEDPALFSAALAFGFGRSKAFGCGLMLIRPG